MESKKLKQRSSNLELLRIISMVLIIIHHYAYNNFVLPTNLTTNKLIIESLLVGKIGVNCFVLISGYFMIQSRVNIKKIIKIWIQVITYSILFLILAYCFNSSKVNTITILKSMFPITHEAYWFITVYIIIYIFSNFINDFINTLSKDRLQKLILLLITIEVIIPTVVGETFEFSNILWFITLYIIGAYMKKFPVSWLNNKKSVILLIISFLITIISIILLNIIGQEVQILYKHKIYFREMMNGLFIFIMSICIFNIFKNAKIRNSKIINIIASSMLGVYLIHTNIFVRDFIWINIFKVGTYINSKPIVLLINIVISVLFIFIVCVIIDLIRKYFVEPIQMKITERVLKKLSIINS